MDARVVGYVISKIEIVRDILAEVGMEDLQDEPLLNECMSRLRINLKGMETIIMYLIRLRGVKGLAQLVPRLYSGWGFLPSQ